MRFWPLLQVKPASNETLRAAVSDKPNIWATSLCGPLVTVVNTLGPPANATMVSGELEAFLSTAQPLIVTRSLSMRLSPSMAPFTSGEPRRPAVCTAAIKPVASETVALAKIATPGGGGAGLVSQNTAAKPSTAAEAPDIHVNHGLTSMLALEAVLVSRGDLSSGIWGRLFAADVTGEGTRLVGRTL